MSKGYNGCGEMPVKKQSIVGVHVHYPCGWACFFHTALWLELLCVESVHAAATGTCMETGSLTRQALNTYAWTCIGLSSLGLLMDTVFFFSPPSPLWLDSTCDKSDSLWTMCTTYYQPCTMLINLSRAAPFSWGKVINVQIVSILFRLVLII